MATAEFISRIVGLFVFTFLGARLGFDADALALPPDASALIFGLVGALVGLILTPWLTVRPIQSINQSIRELPIEVFFMVLLGGFIGLILGLLMAYPLSFLPVPFNEILPPAASLVGGYLGMTIFRVRAREIWDFISENFLNKRLKAFAMSGTRQMLVDTSVLIDGRIVDIAKTGFLGGTLLVPRFVMTELHQVADSSDTLRRNRGRRGLIKLTELQRNNITPVKVIEDDPEDIPEVDDKLVALAIQLDAHLLTNDYPLSKVAESQGVTVLNINLLANAVRSVYIPGEEFPLHIIQEGTDPNQGVGYLDDGTMVVVEDGKAYMDRTVRVEVTKLINREAGRMIFAKPVR
ncbi:MAG: PIN domain nuclease [Phototrophicales bacterium]|nr:MAG: PIN domain nuclease [Phototrophicales bacterium]RMG78002.1 MAG: PIN domain nuclease [Chloroflexota bacterium]